MEKFIKFLKDFVTSSKFKTFLWQTVNGFILLVIVGVTELDWQYVPVLLAVLNGATKYINTTYLK